MTTKKDNCFLCWGWVGTPILSILAVICLAAAIVLAVIFPSTLDSMVEDQVTLESGHATYEQLKEPTLPVWKSIYFFNLTNPEEFHDGAAPVVVQVGPYSYREYRVKYFNHTNSTKDLLAYTQNKTFYFDPEASNSSVKEDDIICTINIPLVAAVAEVDGIDNEIERAAAKFALKEFVFKPTDAKLFMCVEATPLAWNFTTPLVHELHTNEILKLAGRAYPRDWVSIQQNQSINDTRPSIIHTGVDKIDLLGQFVQWDGNYRKMTIWPEETANYINGTEGLFFKPLLHEGEDLEAFVDDVFRSFPLVYTGKVTHKGLQAFRYELPLSVFESAFTNPANARWGSWNPDGLIYIGVIQYPIVPAYGSKPHFLDGDEELREKVKGLHPNRELHETTIDVEPVIGANIQFRKQLQVNIRVNQTSDFDQLENINGTLYYPVFYVDEHAELTNSFKSYLEDKGLRMYYLASKLVWVVFALLLFTSVLCGVLAMVGFALCSRVQFMRWKARHSERRPLLTPKEYVS